MNKEAALKELAELDARSAALRRIIDIPDAPLNPVFIPVGRERYFYIGNVLHGIGGDQRHGRGIHIGSENAGYPAFRTQSDAEDFADAFQVMLELRVQPGIEVKRNKQRQICYFIRATNDWVTTEIDDWDTVGSNISLGAFSCGFKTRSDCQNAIYKIGAERILKAIKTLAWVEE